MSSKKSSRSNATELDLLKSIDEKLSSMIKLLAFNIIINPDQTKAIQYLAKAGMKYAEIGEYFDLSENAVKMRIRDAKVRTKRGKKNEE